MDTSKQKPDLMNPGRVGGDGGKRILAHLEHGPKTPTKPPRTGGWTIDGWTIGLGLLLATMCTIAWMVHENTFTPGSYAHSRSVSTRVEQKPAETVERQAVAAPPVEQAAAIVNESNAKPSPAQTPASASAPETRPPSAPAPAPTTLARSDAPRALGAAHKQAGVATIAAARSPATHAAAVPTPAVAGDTDVALLAALVAHSGKPANVTPERSRDVVERQDGDTTAQLLARCKQLGLIEGMLCRSRICSGRWDADPACNAPSH